MELTVLIKDILNKRDELHKKNMLDNELIDTLIKYLCLKYTNIPRPNNLPLTIIKQRIDRLKNITLKIFKTLKYNDDILELIATTYQNYYNNEHAKYMAYVDGIMRIAILMSQIENNNEDDNHLKTIEKTYADENIQCAICLDEIVKQQTVLETECNHIFHKDCLLTWFQTKQQCPICKHTSEDESPE